MLGLSDRVWQYLTENACGKNNAKLFRTIAMELLPELQPTQAWRRIAKAVEILRAAGKPVCTSRRHGQGGAFIPANREEAKESLRTPYAAMWKQKRGLDKLSHSLEIMFGYELVRDVQAEFEELEIKRAAT